VENIFILEFMHLTVKPALGDGTDGLEALHSTAECEKGKGPSGWRWLRNGAQWDVYPNMCNINNNNNNNNNKSRDHETPHRTPFIFIISSPYCPALRLLLWQPVRDADAMTHLFTSRRSSEQLPFSRDPFIHSPPPFPPPTNILNNS
jgi:hypothetical protein